ncbi:AfsR/SARP family transcriptional regulator [Streptomyces sp. NBC_01022]|nr:AfsR/SARP family transcriptional regulator [Streptomyces sp. NBC_01022]WRZ87536.1 AfsR/SARP family transcriptional regulator [Streptomyces sp. NBC_01022]
MEMGVLGPLSLFSNGVNLAPGAPKPRQLLAFLMLNANQMVRASECIKELWDSSPPKSSMSTLQTYVLQVRQALRGTSPANDRTQSLVTRNHGYQLKIPLHAFDRFRFESLTRRGQEAATKGDFEEASEQFSGALALWRGPALVDVQTGPLSTTHLVELEETRKCVLERRIEADLRLGRHRELRDELGALAVLHPTHENIHAQYMLALHRSGERTRALAVHHGLSRMLRDALGIEPTPRMQRLYEAISSGDPVLDAPTVPARTK